VDSIHSVEAAVQTAKTLAGEIGPVLAVTGPTDVITDGKQLIRVSNGHPLMSYVTGTGCAATSTIGAFLSIDEDPFSATATALAFFGWAGEVAAKKASAPGSFMIAMLDALYTITPEELKSNCKFEN
jgi:hydroxyethylthiazole kinase